MAIIDSPLPSDPKSPSTSQTPLQPGQTTPSNTNVTTTQRANPQQTHEIDAPAGRGTRDDNE
jgi:hypothetical protein